MTIKKIKVFSAFSGIGGLDLPFSKDPRFQIVGFSEIDKFASAVLNYHYPDISNYGDISTTGMEELPDMDIVVAGFPCNDISYQGQQQGIIKGKKSSLFKYLLNILDIKKPKYFLFENVEALLHINGGWDFGYVLSELGKRGYSFRWEVLDSADFGVPQQRKRLFILGLKESQRTSIDNSIPSLYSTIKMQSEERQKLNTTPILGFEDYKIDVDGNVYGKLGSMMKTQDINNYPSVHLRKGNKSFRKLVHILVYETFKGPIPNKFEIHHKDHNKKNTKLSNLELVTSSKNKRLYYEFIGERRGVRELPTGMFESRITIENKSHSIGKFNNKEAAYNAYYWFYLNTFQSEPWEAKKIISWSKSTRAEHIDYRIRQDGFVNTLTTGKGCNGFSTGNLVEVAGRVRILTPLECERFMSLPDNWTEYGNFNGQVKRIPDSQRYKQCGNAVVSSCVEPIKEFILNLENKVFDLIGISHG